MSFKKKLFLDFIVTLVGVALLALNCWLFGASAWQYVTGFIILIGVTYFWHKLDKVLEAKLTTEQKYDSNLRLYRPMIENAVDRLGAEAVRHIVDEATGGE